MEGRRANLYGWLLLMPAVVMLAAFTHYPALVTFWHSLFSTARGKRPHFPVIPEPLELPMAANADEPACANDLRGFRGRFVECVLFGAEPQTTLGFAVNNEMRHKAPNLFIIVRIFLGEEIFLRPRSAIEHQQSRCVTRSGSRHEFHDVPVERQRVVRIPGDVLEDAYRDQRPVKAAKRAMPRRRVVRMRCSPWQSVQTGASKTPP